MLLLHHCSSLTLVSFINQNILISMLEKLLSQTSIDEKKRILANEYGMIMTTELEGRIQTMCNLSENIRAMGIEKGIEEGIKKERINAIGRMIKAGAAKELIISFGYTEDEFAEAEDTLYMRT